jgi:hypothetical protein
MPSSEILNSISYELITRTCPCKKVFQTYMKNDLYCSDDCKEKYRPKKHRTSKKGCGGWTF